MSSSEEDERKEYIRRDPVVRTTPPTQSEVIVSRPAEGVVQVERVPTVVASPVERREEIVKHKTTNTGALAAIAVGIVVLLSGLYLVLTQVRYIPWPYSDIVVLVVGMILVAIGASVVSESDHNLARISGLSGGFDRPFVVRPFPLGTPVRGTPGSDNWTPATFSVHSRRIRSGERHASTVRTSLPE